MKFTIKSLVAAAALAAASASSFAAVLPGGDLGTLDKYPSIFGARNGGEDPNAPGVSFSHEYFFTLAADASVIGSAEYYFFDGTTFSSVKLFDTADMSGNPLATQTFADLGSIDFEFNGLTAGSYSVVLEGFFPQGNQDYSGAIYAAAPIPEPQALAMLLAGLGVAGAVVHRRRKV